MFQAIHRYSFYFLNYILLQSLCSATAQTYASSHYNDFTSDLAVDGDVNTYFHSGFETHIWWAWKIASPVPVAKVTVRGKYAMPNLKILVGDQPYQPLGFLPELNYNPTCVRYSVGPVMINNTGGMEFQCREVRTGKFLSLHTDTLTLDIIPLVLYEVKIN